LLLLLVLFNGTANGFLPCGSGTTIRHDTQKYTYHTKYHTMLKQYTAHKATQIIHDTLHRINTTQKKSNYKTIILPAVVYGCETWSLTLREEDILRVFENRVLRRTFEPKRDEGTGDWRKLQNDELHNLL
jgi:hypothetical protein